jgi:hypothetical protein
MSRRWPWRERRNANQTQSQSASEAIVSAFRALFTSADVWLDADNYNPAGAKIGSFVNVVDPTNLWSQATPAAQVPLPNADLAFGGARSTVWTGTEYYASNRPAALGKYRHDGSGVTECAVWVPLATSATNNIFLADGNGAQATAIFYFGGNGTSGNLRVLLPANWNSLANPYDNPIDAGAVSMWTYSEAASPKWTLRKGTIVFVSGSTTAPNPADPPSPTHLGATPVLDSMSNMRLRAVYSWHRVLSATEIEVVRKFIELQTGLGSMFQQVRALAAGRPVFTADYYAVDGVSSKLAALIDWNDPAHTVSQPVSANQAAVPAPHPSYANQRCVSMVGDVYYVSNRSVAYWGTLQAETGYSYDTFCTVATATQCLWETGNGSELPASIARYLITGNPNYADVRPRVSPAVVTTLNRAGVAVDVGFLTRYRRTPTTVYLRASNGGAETSGALTVSMDGSASARPLTVGRSSLVSSNRMRHLMWFPDLDPAGLVTVDQYIYSDCGIPLPPINEVIAIAAGKPVFTADYYAVDGVTLKVAGWIDFSDVTHLLAQSTSAAQVAIPAAHADYAGARCATFTGAETYVSNRPPLAFEFVHDGSGLSLFDCFTATTAAGVHSLVCTTSSAGVRGIACYSVTADLRSSVEKTGASVYPDSSVGAIAANVPTYRELSHGTARSPQFDLRAKGTTITSGAYASVPEAGAPGHTLRIGSNSGFTLPYIGRWRDLIVTAGVTPAQRTTIQNYYLATTGITP